MSSLLELMRKTDKTGAFERTPTDVSYPTGFHTLDHKNGYWLETFDENDKVVKRHKSVGIVAGTFNAIIGKSGVAKTTGAVQMAINIIRPFKSSFVVHYDAENAFNYTRIHGVSGMSMQELKTKYLLKRSFNVIEDIHESIMEIAKTKKSHGKEFMYNTGIQDEFGDDIHLYEPTVVLIDSLPSLALKNTVEDSEMQTQAYGMQKARAFSEFCGKLVSVCKEMNIIVLYINHIKKKISINPFAKEQSQQIYLKQDETLPLGEAGIYYANNIFKFISGGKYTTEKHGFDGFLVKCELIKSRTNKSGQIAELVYDQAIGFDTVRALLNLAEGLKLTTGNNPNRRFVGHPDVRYSSLKFTKQFQENPELRFALLDTVMPHLEADLSTQSEIDNTPISEKEIMNILAKSAERHDDVEEAEEDKILD